MNSYNVNGIQRFSTRNLRKQKEEAWEVETHGDRMVG